MRRTGADHRLTGGSLRKTAACWAPLLAVAFCPAEGAAQAIPRLEAEGLLGVQSFGAEWATASSWRGAFLVSPRPGWSIGFEQVPGFGDRVFARYTF